MKGMDSNIEMDNQAKYETVEIRKIITLRVENEGDETRDGAADLESMESITFARLIGYLKYAWGHQLNTSSLYAPG
jgi:hypothetical protein